MQPYLENMQQLPISKINTVVFCPRRYYIEHVLSESQTNQHLIEGEFLHDRAKRPGQDVWVYSDQLGLVGILDQLSREGDPWVPTELKKGKMGHHQSDRVQLCAQAMCLEEMGYPAILYGYVYYHASRRKARVEFDEALRQEVIEAIQQMRILNAQDHLPPITDNPQKCRGCSVHDICQPELFREGAS